MLLAFGLIIFLFRLKFLINKSLLTLPSSLFVAVAFVDLAHLINHIRAEYSDFSCDLPLEVALGEYINFACLRHQN